MKKLNSFAELKLITSLVIGSGVVFIERIISNALHHSKHVDDSENNKDTVSPQTSTSIID